MKQILQHLRTGETKLEDVPAPGVEPGHLLICNRATLVSQGTEKMLVQFGKASLFQKARSQPEKVKQVLAKIRTEGLRPTLEAVFRKLDEPLPLGYCAAGEVIGIGPGVVGFTLGERVASNGPHAEIVAVPVNLVAKVPAGVSDHAAAFTVIGAIGLQGIRLAQPELGETFVVIGLGLIGQLTAQLLKAHGCRVIGFDFDGAKVDLASSFGIEAVRAGGEVDPVKWVQSQTGGMGADAVLITASTSSNDVIRQSAQMSRKRGRIVLVGVVGLELNRADFYEKELSFQVSCSYGPGRYDDAYEEKGFDYPMAFVRWTENRNFLAVLAAMASGALKVEPLITKRVPLERFSEIYDQMDGGGLASILIYDRVEGRQTAEGGRRTPEDGGRRAGDGERATAEPGERMTDGGRRASEDRQRTAGDGGRRTQSTIRLNDRQFSAAEGALALVGAGNFAKMTAMPALAAVAAPVKIVVSSGGVTGTSLAKKYRVPLSSTDFGTVLADPEVQGVIITTRHDLHAAQTAAALRAGKRVLVEKPLCLTLDEFGAIAEVMGDGKSVNSDRGMVTGDRGLVTRDQGLGHGSPATHHTLSPWVTVGFNRRFSPHVVKMKALLGENPGALSVIATMNAGAIPLNHWVHDPLVGGGRLVGEACHFVDLAVFLTGSLIEAVNAAPVGEVTDCASILLRHANGSVSVVNYLANGNREVSKERVEVHSQGRTLLLDNFCELRGYGFRSFAKLKTKLDKGHAAQFGLFAQRVKEGGPALIPWAEIANVTRATLAIPQSLAERRWVRVGGGGNLRGRDET